MDNMNIAILTIVLIYSKLEHIVCREAEAVIYEEKVEGFLVGSLVFNQLLNYSSYNFQLAQKYLYTPRLFQQEGSCVRLTII